MSRCPDQVVSLKRDPQCLSPHRRSQKCFKSKAEFTPRLSASSVERRADQRPYLARDEVSDWLYPQRSTLTALV
ncbi:hypothetical protein TNCV_2517811 [Trichonephila clavipes]|nr:hypothetical protein TNCV_2517811 [Trichonephila clavipes]